LNYMLKNTKILIIGVAAFVVLVLVIAGYSIFTVVQRPAVVAPVPIDITDTLKEVVPSPAPIVATSELSESEAREIAEKTCIKNGEIWGTGTYAEQLKYWWFPPTNNTAGPKCRYNCIVSEATKKGKIEWSCNN
jgi:hypothetical protein